jgi:sulfonate transport system permease protein
VKALASRAWRAWILARPFLVPLGLLALWETLSRTGAAGAYAFVPLRKIGEAILEVTATGELLANVRASLLHACTGLVTGSVAGLLFGAVVGTSPLCDRLFGPLYHGLRQVPLLGLAPLIGLWFGNGDGAKLLVVSLAAFYPVALGTADGLRNAERAHLELGRALVFGRSQVFRHILLPRAVPFIVAGLLQALAFTWLATVGSELLFTAGAGLGSFMQQGEANGRMELVIVGIATIALVGLAMNAIVTRASRRLLPWRQGS